MFEPLPLFCNGEIYSYAQNKIYLTKKIDNTKSSYYNFHTVGCCIEIYFCKSN